MSSRHSLPIQRLLLVAIVVVALVVPGVARASDVLCSYIQSTYTAYDEIWLPLQWINYSEWTADKAFRGMRKDQYANITYQRNGAAYDFIWFRTSDGLNLFRRTAIWNSTGYSGVGYYEAQYSLNGVC